MTSRLKKISAFAGTLATSMAVPSLVLAQNDLNANDLGMDAINDSIKLGGGSGDVQGIAANIINVALSFLGIIAVVIVLIGGFKYMTSGGSEEKTTEARKLIVSGIIGLAIILSAWAITSFVVSRLVGATQG
jgi:Zn-dependent protease with chaperone function